MSISEVTRDAQRIVMELTEEQDGTSVRIEFDDTGHIIALEQPSGNRIIRVEFEWDPDLDLLALPPIELRMSDDDLAELEAAFYELYDDGSGREIVIID